MTLGHPWYLLLLMLLFAILWQWWRSQGSESIRFSSAMLDWSPRPTWRQRLLWVPKALTMVALMLLIVSLARPRYGRERTIVHSEGIAIEMVVDRSGSMQALDFKVQDRPVDRLQAIKNVASKFILGGEASGSDLMHGRIADLVGLITFAGYADAISPPTLDHAFLVDQLGRTQIVDQPSEDGTAIGDAITLAVEKLSSLDNRRIEKVKAKIVILLTDGENTAGEIEPARAAELAAAKGIKVYTIAVGTRGRAPFPIRSLPGGRVQVQYVDVNVDEETLQMIAAQTGGKFYRATDTQSLTAIYNEIDQLEKTRIDSQTFFDYRELAIQGADWRGYHVPPLVLIALVALALRIVTEHMMLRRAT